MSIVAPGWIDIQVNGFAGVDYNDPHAPHEEIARADSRAIRERRHALLSHRDHRRAGRHGSGAAQPVAREGFAAGRRGDRRLSRGGPAYRNRGRPARRASEALGAQARFRRVPPLAGRHGRPRAHRDALAGMARGAAIYRAHRGGRRGGVDRTYRRRARSRSPMRLRRARRFRRISGMARTR